MSLATEPRWSATRALAACFTLVLALVLVSLGPSVALRDGWQTAILALELARDPADLAFLAGPAQQDARDAFRTVHAVDMVFPVAYVAMLYLAISTRVSVGARRALRALAALTVLFDWAENTAIWAVLGALDQAQVPGLTALIITTWLKWGAIGALLAWHAGTRPLARLWRILGAAAALSVPIAGLTGAPLAGEAMGGAITLAIGGHALHQVWATLAAWRKRRATQG